MNVVDKDTVLCISLAARPGNHGNRFHNFLYAELGLNFLYKSFSSSDIAATIGGIRSLGIRGTSVSMPYKESCMPFLDRIDPSAAVIDSVNTIVNDDGVLTGYNTDYLAVRQILERAPAGADFALLGSGGMAKACLAALVDEGFTTGTVVARNAEQGAALADRYGVQWAPRLAGLRPSLLVNATPIGMAGGPDASRLAFDEEAIAAARAVIEVVFTPVATPLVRSARAAQVRFVVTGDEILLLQAVEQFVRYTGVRPTERQVAEAEAFASAA